MPAGARQLWRLQVLTLLAICGGLGALFLAHSRSQEGISEAGSLAQQELEVLKGQLQVAQSSQAQLEQELAQLKEALVREGQRGQQRSAQLKALGSRPK